MLHDNQMSTEYLHYRHVQLLLIGCMPSKVIVNKTHHNCKRLGTPTLELSTISESKPECHPVELGVQRLFFK